MDETAKGIELKNQETLKEKRAIEYKQTRAEFCYARVGIRRRTKFIFLINTNEQDNMLTSC